MKLFYIFPDTFSDPFDRATKNWGGETVVNIATMAGYAGLVLVLVVFVTVSAFVVRRFCRGVVSKEILEYRSENMETANKATNNCQTREVEATLV